MWHIGFLVCISCLTTVIIGQSNPPPRITYFLKDDLDKPDQVKFGKEYNSLNNGGFKIPCDATGSNLQWTWKHNGTAIVFPNLKYKLGDDGSLTGEYLKAENSGTYQCFVKDTDTNRETFSRKLKIAVTYVGDFPIKNDETQVVDLGESLSIKCPPHAPSYGGTLTWESREQIQFKRDKTRAISPDGELYIMYVTDADINGIAESKGIRCTIAGANTFYRSGFITLQKRPGSVDPLTKKSPTWAKNPKGVEKAIEGKEKILYCLAVGRPAPTITWKKNGIEIVNGQKSFEIDASYFGRRLRINNVQKDDHEDVYTCEAENDQNTGDPLKFPINLIVEIPPRFGPSPPPAKKTINIEGSGTLLCDVVADPVPAYTWYFNGGPVPSSPQVKINNNKLEFRNVQLVQDGVYQCVAESYIGMIVSSTWVFVLAKKPTFANFGPIYLFRDSVGRIKCQPEAAPPANFRWFKSDGSEITNSSDGYYTSEQDGIGTLVINKVTDKDAIEYTCTAKNIMGTASEKAKATVLERTIIEIKPQDKNVKEGVNVDLRCEAKTDESLELRYYWKRDGATIVYIPNKIEWFDGQEVLKISDITVEDAGVYTCVAYTPEPKRSEDTASAVVNIQGVPYPPTRLRITKETCENRTTTLFWFTSVSNDAPILHFLVEQESDHEPNVFRLIYNVTNPNATSVQLNLTGWAVLRFRMRAVNILGPSRPSESTEAGICRTSQGKPDKFPDNFKGDPKKAEELDFVWDPLPMVDWNAPGYYIILQCRRVEGGASGKWTIDQKISDRAVGRFSIPNPGYYKLWECRILAGNDVGQGPWSPIVQSYSGQDPPEGTPGGVSVGEITARSVQLSWTAVPPSKGGSVDGYRVYYWGESRLVITAKRRRRAAIPSNAEYTDISGGNTEKATVFELKPYTNYKVSVKAFNSGGEGPGSDEVSFNTIEAVPGPSSDVKLYAFAKYILVTWERPLEPNGIITNYLLGSAKYPGSEPKDVPVDKLQLGRDDRSNLIGKQEPLTNYVVELIAKNSVGDGEAVRKTTRTVKISAPAKPEKPTVTGTAVDKVKVCYNFGLGGGYTHEFRIMYRKKLRGEEFVNSSWVNHFEEQCTEISGLDSGLYEFKTVGKNDQGESPASDITEGRPQPGVLSGKRTSTPIHKTAWFIALLVLIAILLLVLLIFVLYTRHRGAKYPVGKREKKRAALIDREPYDEEEGAYNNAGDENPPPYPSQGSLDKRHPDSDRDSLDDYGEGPQFNEDGSFIEEYGDEKKAPQGDEKDQSAFATFV